MLRAAPEVLRGGPLPETMPGFGRQLLNRFAFPEAAFEIELSWHQGYRHRHASYFARGMGSRRAFPDQVRTRYIGEYHCFHLGRGLFFKVSPGKCYQSAC